MTDMIRELSFDEVDAVSGGASVSDGLGLALGGFGLIGASIGLTVATGGIAGPVAIIGIAAGVTAMHAGLIVAMSAD